MKVSIVIPIYNEVKTFSTILNSVIASCDKNFQSYEIILVEDYSTDGTREYLQDQTNIPSNTSVYFQEVNRGKGAAITKGFSKTTGDVVIIQDADMEYDPEEYPILMKPIEMGKADVVFGSRFKGDTSRVLYYWHYLGNSFLTLLSNMFTNLNLSDMETCYKVFKGDIIRNMILTSSRFGIEPEMTAKISKLPGVRIYEVPISYYGRTYEEGKKIGWKDGVSALYSIVKFNLFYSYKSSYKKVD